MTEIEFRNASYRERPYGGGRLIRRVEASWGSISRHGTTKTEAKAALLAAISEQLAHTYTRRYLRTADVTFALFYCDGWGYDIVTGDGARSSSTLLGDVPEQEAFESMKRHFEQYTSGIDAQSVDRTNGELDAAVLAYREDPSEANRDRCLAAQERHHEAFLREQTAEFMARTA